MCAAPGLHVSLDRVQNGYVSSGTGGYTRPTADALKGANSSKNVPASARAWTRVPHSSFPRNEGVPGSSPGVGFSRFAGLSSALATLQAAFGYETGTSSD